MDLYRLTDPEELEYLGIDDLARQADICLIEWPERGAGALPAPTLTLFLDHQSKGRQLQVQAHTEIGEVWLQAVKSHFST
jgi:tRNA threonylcarbamoyladenosine biosynthesis protein TsaE